MSINLHNINITLSFTPEDLAVLKKMSVQVPNFWDGHKIPPMKGDVLRFGALQFVIVERVWEHDGDLPNLRLYLSDRSLDTTP